MRQLRRTGYALLLATLLVLNTACPKKATVVSIAEDVVAAAEEFLPVAESAGVPTGNIKTFLKFSKLGLAAIKTDDGTALGHYEVAFTALRAVVGDVAVIKDPLKRTLALALVGIIDRTLHKLVDQLPPSTPGLTGSSITEFRKHKVWRCRSSVTGQFKKLEFCKANPATTTVEVR